MTGYGIVNLKELVEQVGENRAKEILSTFSCPHNKDVEYFLRSKAIEFSKQGIAQTQLVIASFRDEPVLVGYFTLALKEIVVSRKAALASRWRQRIRRFGTYSDLDNSYHVPAPLIGQLGKNFTNKYNELITGDELLKIALDKVKQTQLILGGKFVYLECENKPILVQFYETNGFVKFGNRNLEREEMDRQSGQYLVQMLKFLG